ILSSFHGMTKELPYDTTVNSPESCQALQLKIFRFTGILIYGITGSARAAMRDVSRSSRSVVRVAMDACGVRRVLPVRRKRRGVRRNRVVLAPRPWRLSGSAYLGAGNGDNQRRSP